MCAESESELGMKIMSATSRRTAEVPTKVLSADELGKMDGYWRAAKGVEVFCSSVLVRGFRKQRGGASDAS
jgi:hypothetical protein